VDVMGDDGAASGSIALMVEQGLPPYEFVWSNGAESAEIGDLEVGGYEVTVTDGNGCGFVEMFEVELLVGQADVEAMDVGVKLFPNPVGEGGLVFGEVRGVVEFPVEVRVWDALGRVMLEKVVERKDFSLVLKDTGVYFVEANFGNGGKMYFKVVKSE
jgi:hypothetical protein